MKMKSIFKTLTCKCFTALFSIAMITAAASCGGGAADKAKSQADSLAMVNKDLSETIDFMYSAIDSLDSQQEQLFVFNNDGSDKADQRTLLRQRLSNLAENLNRQKQRLSELVQRLSTSEKGNAQLQKLISMLKVQLNAKDEQIAKLTREVEEGKMTIAQLRTSNDELTSSNTQLTNANRSLNKTNSSLKQNVDELNERTNAQQEEIVAKDNALNECYYLVASKKELKGLGLLSSGNLFKKGKVQLQNVDKGTFHSADRRSFTSLSISGKKVKILSPVPSGSYTLTKEGSGYQLHITKPTEFWSLSNYLLIQTD